MKNPNPYANMAQPRDAICHQLPMRGGCYLAQVVVPRNMTHAEADRLCAFVRALASPDGKAP